MSLSLKLCMQLHSNVFALEAVFVTVEYRQIRESLNLHCLQLQQMLKTSLTL